MNKNISFSLICLLVSWSISTTTYAQEALDKHPSDTSSYAFFATKNLEFGALSRTNQNPNKSLTSFFQTNPIDYSYSQIQYPLYSKGDFQSGIELIFRLAHQQKPQNQTSTDLGNVLRSRAYLRYQLTPNYSLNSGVEFDNASKNTFRLSLTAKAGFRIKKNHQWASLLNVSWGNRNNNSDDFWNQNRLFGEPNYGRMAESGHFTQVSLGTQWQWNVSSNLSLTTGANVKHMLGSKHNVFLQNRTPVSVFSAIQYRF
jgi:hypothetical protein